MSKGSSFLGIIDWGIGGISVNKLIKSRLGQIPVLYFSDTGATPYGKMSQSELVTRLNKLADFLGSQGVTHLVLGCNAASTALPFLSLNGMRVEGVIKSAVRVTRKMRPERLALIGGRRTVLSGVYRRAFALHGIGLKQRVAQPLSALIENGDVSSSKLREECRRILAPIKNCSHLLLACTHYPAIVPMLKEFVSRDTVLIDPAAELVNQIAKWDLPKGNADVFLTSGDPEKMKSSAWNAFGVKIRSAKAVTPDL